MNKKNFLEDLEWEGILSWDCEAYGYFFFFFFLRINIWLIWGSQTSKRRKWRNEEKKDKNRLTILLNINE